MCVSVLELQQQQQARQLEQRGEGHCYQNCVSLLSYSTLDSIRFVSHPHSRRYSHRGKLVHTHTHRQEKPRICVSYPSILVVYSTSRKHTTTSTGSWELGSGMGDGNGDSDGKRRQWEKERERWRERQGTGELQCSLGSFSFRLAFLFSTCTFFVSLPFRLLFIRHGLSG